MKAILQIHNLNSGQAVTFHQHGVEARLGALAHVAARTLVYLVDEPTMDCLYPPKKRWVLDEERLKEFLSGKSLEKTLENPDEVLERCLRKASDEVFIAVGVYIRDLTSREQQCLPRPLPHPGPVVFICPERVVNWARKLGLSDALVFETVLHHEMGHADLDGGTPTTNTWWERVIEESLANGLALTRFRDYRSRAGVTRLILSQPIEYRGCLRLTDPAVGGPPYPRAIIEFFHRRLWRLAAKALIARLAELPEDPDLWLRLLESADPEEREKILAHPFGEAVAVLRALAGQEEYGACFLPPFPSLLLLAGYPFGKWLPHLWKHRGLPGTSPWMKDTFKHLALFLLADMVGARP